MSEQTWIVATNGRVGAGSTSVSLTSPSVTTPWPVAAVDVELLVTTTNSADDNFPELALQVTPLSALSAVNRQAFWNNKSGSTKLRYRLATPTQYTAQTYTLTIFQRSVVNDAYTSTIAVTPVGSLQFLVILTFIRAY